MVTHLFNAMQSFHHRDPGLVGLLTSEKLAGGRVWCGIIADGVHAHPAAIRIAYKTSFKQLVLVTDAIVAMGFKDGRYKFGQQTIEVRGEKAYVADTQVSEERESRCLYYFKIPYQIITIIYLFI